MTHAYKESNYHLWQPFTQMRTFLEGDGVIIERGDGPLLIDTNGKEYLNMTSSVWNVPFGLGQQDIAEAIYEQLQHLGYGSLFRTAHTRAIELGALVAEITPGKLNRVFLTSNGSESIETGIKMARQYFWAQGSKKHKVISLELAYHGCSYGALAASGFAEDKAAFGPIPEGFIQIPPPYCYRCPYGANPENCELECAQKLEETVLRENPDEVAMFLMEPVLGLGGVIIPSRAYFRKIVEICDKYDILLMLDEVTTGYGRTGKLFAANHWDLEPDIMAMGKAMSSGYWPLGACVATDQIFEQFLGKDDSTRFNHGSTYSGHPGGVAAGLATIRRMLDDDAATMARRKGEYFFGRLQELLEYPMVGDVRGIGMMFAIEFVRDKETKEPLSAEELKQIHMACFAAGVWVHGAGSKLLMLPPFIIDQSLMDDAITRLHKVMRKAQNWLSLG